MSLFWAALTAGRVAAAGAAAKLPPHAVLLCSLPLAVLGACVRLASCCSLRPASAVVLWHGAAPVHLLAKGAAAPSEALLAASAVLHPCCMMVPRSPRLASLSPPSFCPCPAMRPTGPVAIVAMPGSSVGLSLGLVACGLGISAGFANSVSLLARVTPVSPTTQARGQEASGCARALNHFACSGGGCSMGKAAVDFAFAGEQHANGKSKTSPGKKTTTTSTDISSQPWRSSARLIPQSLMQLSAAGGALTIAPFMLTLAKGDLGPMALPLVTGTFAAAAIALVVGTHASSSHVLRGFKKKAAADDIGGV